MAARKKIPVRKRPAPSRTTARTQRDIIVMGASAGGVEALKAVIERLPEDLPAAIFVVQHVPAHPPSHLPAVLNGRGRERAVHATHGEQITPGRIYVAPPDMHMTIADGYVRVVRGPKENGHRPAVDPLFRSAARWYGPRVVGVVLSGARDCGAMGLAIIKAHGGLAMVQDPQEAFCDSMPMHAMRAVEVDYILRTDEMAAMLVKLVGPGSADVNAPLPGSVTSPLDTPDWKNANLTCPNCSGALQEAELGKSIEFRCHVGHRFNSEGMVAEQTEALESALWAAVRAFHESEGLARRTAARSPPDLALRLEEKADLMRAHSEVIRRMLLQGAAGHPADPVGAIEIEEALDDDA